MTSYTIHTRSRSSRRPSALLMGAGALLFAYASLSFALPHVVAAAEGGLTVFPSKVEIRAKPGDEAEKAITVVNSGAEELRVTTEVADYVIRPDNSFIFLPAGAKSYSSSRWVSIDKPDFRLAPGKSRQVNAAISIPGRAEPGGHYSSVIFRAESGAPSGQGLRIVSAVAVQLLTSVGDGSQIVRNGIVTGFLNRNGRFDRDVESTVKFRNRGNVHLSIKGRVVYHDVLGRQLGSAPLQPITVLPHTTRITKARWTGPRIGLIKARATIEYGPDLATYDTRKFSSKIQFWIIPWREGIAVIAVLVALAIIFRAGFIRRSIRRLNRPDRKAA